MTYHAVIYTKVNCPKCRMTVHLFETYRIPYQNSYYGNLDEPNLIDLDATNERRRCWSQKKVEKLKAKGVHTMPYVEVIDDQASAGKKKPVIVDDWSDFRPDKIKHLAQVWQSDQYSS